MLWWMDHLYMTGIGRMFIIQFFLSMYRFKIVYARGKSSSVRGLQGICYCLICLINHLLAENEGECIFFGMYFMSKLIN